MFPAPVVQTEPLILQTKKNATEKLKIVLERDKNIVGKGEIVLLEFTLKIEACAN